MEVRQENPLERILRLAADEPAHRPEFLRVLLNSTVYVLGSAGAGEGTGSLEAGTRIGIQHSEKRDGTPVIPFFSSLEVLQKSIETEQSYLALPAKSLFEMTLGTNLVLNPSSRYAKEFVPEEVENLLSDGVGRKPTQRTVQKETKVLLGQPAKYPSQMVDSLTQLFAEHSNVRRGFIALIYDASVDDKPHLIVGIEADGDIELVLRQAGSVVADTAPDGEPVDFCRVSEHEAGLSKYFLTQTKPFYEQKWGTTLRSLLGIRKA
jgi:hypothetical protein